MSTTNIIIFRMACASSARNISHWCKWPNLGIGWQTQFSPHSGHWKAYNEHVRGCLYGICILYNFIVAHVDYLAKIVDSQRHCFECKCSKSLYASNSIDHLYSIIECCVFRKSERKNKASAEIILAPMDYLLLVQRNVWTVHTNSDRVICCWNELGIIQVNNNSNNINKTQPSLRSLQIWSKQCARLRFI